MTSQPVFHEPAFVVPQWVTDGPGGSQLFSGATQLRVLVDGEHHVHVGIIGPDPDLERLAALLDRAEHERMDDDRYVALIVAYSGEWEAVTHVHYSGSMRPAFPLTELAEFARAYLGSLRS